MTIWGKNAVKAKRKTRHIEKRSFIGVFVWIMNSERELLLQTRSSHVMFPNMLDIPINEYSFCDNEVKEVRYIPLDEFKKMVESGSPLLLPYETHYHFLLITLNSRLIQ